MSYCHTECTIRRMHRYPWQAPCKVGWNIVTIWVMDALFFRSRREARSFGSIPLQDCWRFREWTASDNILIFYVRRCNEPSKLRDKMKRTGQASFFLFSNEECSLSSILILFNSIPLHRTGTIIKRQSGQESKKR